jgi:hypothetical protein
MALVNRPLKLTLPDEKIAEEYDVGKSVLQLSKDYDCAPQTIRRRLRKQGRRIRPASTYPRKGGRPKKKPMLEDFSALEELQDLETPVVPEKPKRKIGW